MDSETDDNWEDFSSTTSSDEEPQIIVKQKADETTKKQVLKPWDESQLEQIHFVHSEQSNQKEVEAFESLTFEREENAKAFLNSLDKEKLNSKELTERIFRIATCGYRQVGHDTNKPIIIEFDSFLLNLFQNPAVDWSMGGQFLLLAFHLERFIFKLSAGGRALEINAFRCLDPLWRCPVRRLARQALLKHLQTRCRVRVRIFENWWDEEWKLNLRMTVASFVLISGCEENGLVEKSVVSEIMRFALFLLGEEVCCVRVEELFYYSNALFGFVFNVFPAVCDFLRKNRIGYGSLTYELNGDITGRLNSDFNKEKSTTIDDKNEIEQENEKSFYKVIKTTIKPHLENNVEILNSIRELKISPSQVIVLYGCTQLLSYMKEIKPIEQEMDSNSPIFAVKVFLISVLAKEHLSLRQRVFYLKEKSSRKGETNGDLAEKDKKLVDFITFLCETILSIFEKFTDSECDVVCDLIDGRLFSKIEKMALELDSKDFTEELSSEILTQSETLWKALVSLPTLAFLSNVSFLPLKNAEAGTFSSPAKIHEENHEVKMYSLYKMEGTIEKELNGEIDEWLCEKGLLYEQIGDEMRKSDKIEKIDDNLFICDDLEKEMKNLEQNKTRMVKMDERELKFESKNKTKYVAFMNKYSETLAQPKIVLRDVIVEDIGEKRETESKETTLKKTKGKKQKNARKALIMNRTKSKQSQKAKEDILIFIQQALKPLKLEKKIEKLDEKLLPLKEPSIALPGQIQLLEWLKEYYRKSNPEKDKYPATLLFRNIYDIYRRFRHSLTIEQFNQLQAGLIMMGFIKENKKLVEDFNSFNKNVIAKTIDYTNDIYCEPIGMSCVRFQLKHTGHFMVRSIKSQEDSRVSGFFPDDWQRLFLDAVDNNESCLVVTPTSSGKTFISYYTMKKILNENKTTTRKNEKNFIVFVCPSKTLVNQVSADIYQRYGWIFGEDTLDYNRNVLECEVLVTLPESFEKILLSPPFESFVKRIKYVIMDEIHSIGDSMGGEVWERIILLIQCPFIALSATLGNPQLFHKWLERASNARAEKNGEIVKPKVNLIEFYERWSDLEKYIFIPKNCISPTMTIEDFDTDLMKETSSMVSINPFSAFKLGFFTNENFRMLKIDLTSKDCLEIFDAMQKTIKELPEKRRQELLPKIKTLDPEQYFRSPCITKNEVTEYGKKLKQEVQSWHELGNWEEMNTVFEILSKELLEKIDTMEGEESSRKSAYKVDEIDTEKREGKDEDAHQPQLLPLPNTLNKDYNGPYSDDFLLRQLIPMLVEMRNNADLPAIIFARSQKLCNTMALETLKYLEHNEKFVMSRSDLKEKKKNQKMQIKNVKAWKRERDRIEKKKEEEMMKEGQIPQVNIEGDDEDVDMRFSFIGPGERMDEEDMKYWLLRTLKMNNWSKGHPFIRCINRGIAVHHDGMSKSYRTLVEVLFRARHIKVVLTVGTLALGINMPCRTTVFAGDSSELTPLRYSQMMGRAGRRGYDNIGKVIFFGIPPAKISYLMTSSLLSLHGNDTLTMTTFLRNLFCIFDSKDKQFRLTSFKNMMKRTFGKDFHSDEEKEQFNKQIKLLYRYSMEFLYQNDLINNKLIPVNLSGLVTHLYATEPANFVFAILFHKGVFNKICVPLNLAEPTKESEKTKEQKQNESLICTRLLEVLVHVFFRVPLPCGFKKSSYCNSKVILDPLQTDARIILDRFNATTIALYTQFYRLSSALCDGAESEVLPLSKMQFEGKIKCSKDEDKCDCLKSFCEKCNRIEARSGFAALSGSSEFFCSGAELLDTACVQHIDLKKTDSIPVVELKDFLQKNLKLNAYALDFFKHGSLCQVMKENNLPELFAWNMLKKWSLTLRSISHSLQHLCGGLVGAELEVQRKTCYAFKILSEMFDSPFGKIGEIVDYNYK